METSATIEEDLEGSVFYLMRRALEVGRRGIDRELEPQELTSAQCAPLLKLYLNQASTVGELARECKHDAGSMTRLLDRLEAKGLCHRERLAKDRRTVIIRLTERGREVARAVPSILGKVEAAQLTRFSVEETELLHKLLRRIVDGNG